MTNERLAEIKAELGDIQTFGCEKECGLELALELVAEVEWLRERNAKLEQVYELIQREIPK